MTALYLTKDLFFGSRVMAAARALGAELTICGAASDLLQRAAVGDCSLVLLDLDTPGLDPAAIVSPLREREGRPPTIVAFGSHVHEARLEAARQAGCDTVLTRSQFDRQMQDILRSYAVKS